MITDLHISNYALIDSVDVTFGPGLNIITGETGAGKSIILGALGLLLGARADSRVIRYPDKKSVVEATFTISGCPDNLRLILAEAEIDLPEGCTALTLRRELSATGRNRVMVNDSLTTLSTLQAVASQLVDIHSQHQNALLSDPKFQLRLIDSFAGNDSLLASYGEAYAAYKQALRRYRLERAKLDGARREEEYLRFQFAQLADANLRPGEVEQKEAELHRLENSAAMIEARSAISALLDDDECGALTKLELAASQASRLSDLGASPRYSQLESRLESLRIELADICEAYASAGDDEVGGQAAIDAVEERLNLLYTLLRRHNVDSVEALIAIRDDMGEKLRAIDLGDETLKSLEIEAKRAKKAAINLARELTGARRRESSGFAAMLANQARPLGLDNLVVEIAIEDSPLGPSGADSVEFRFAFNKNQTPVPVGSGASGGEISRLMLALKSLAAEKLQLPAIVFDEVDTGVSGAIAARMGLLMKQISAEIQVIAITHLPQVAAMGRQHFRVFKHDTDSATLTSVELLSPSERVGEIAKMLSASDVDEAAVANAQALLRQSN